MSKIRIRLNIINIAIFTLVALIIYSGSAVISRTRDNIDTLEYTIEQHWRQQARLSINHTIKVFDSDIHEGLVDPYNNNSVSKWADTNFNKLYNGSGITNNWIGELGSGKILDNNTSKLVIKSDDTSKIFADKYTNYDNSDNIIKIIEKIKSGTPTDYNDNIWCSIDGMPEWIEYSYYPIYTGLDGAHEIIDGEKNENYRRFVFVLGTKSSEVLKHYSGIINKQKNIILFIYITIILSFISSIIFMFIILFNQNK